MKRTLREVMTIAGIRQVDVIRMMLGKYGVWLSPQNFSKYCGYTGIGRRGCWKTLLKCLADDFGIIRKGCEWKWAEEK